jgi:4'-phosphopantetheinyl transferase N-terminal domain
MKRFSERSSAASLRGASASKRGAEEQLIAKAVDKRRREFATVRSCARSVLAALGVAPAPVPTGEKGSPLTSFAGRWMASDGLIVTAIAPQALAVIRQPE